MKRFFTILLCLFVFSNLYAIVVPNPGPAIAAQRRAREEEKQRREHEERYHWDYCLTEVREWDQIHKVKTDKEHIMYTIVHYKEPYYKYLCGDHGFVDPAESEFVRFATQDEIKKYKKDCTILTAFIIFLSALVIFLVVVTITYSNGEAFIYDENNGHRPSSRKTEW